MQVQSPPALPNDLIIELYVVRNFKCEIIYIGLGLFVGMWYGHCEVDETICIESVINYDADFASILYELFLTVRKQSLT